MNLSVFDWVIFLVFMTGLIGVGLWSRRLSGSVSRFTVAGRSMGMWLGLSTAYAEGIGLISIANYSQLGFTKGFSFIWLTLAGLLLLNIPLFGILGLGIERFRATGVQTLPQYYEMRYSRKVRVFAGITLGIGGVLNMALFPVVGSQFLIVFLGLPETISIAGMSIDSFPAMLFMVLALSVFFTMIGGMITVIITDYLQSVIMFFSITIISAVIFYTVGGAGIKEAIETNLGAAAFNPFLKSSIGPIFIMVFFINQFIHRLAFPPALQKMSSAKSPKVVRKMFLLASIFGQGRVMMMVLWGIAALAILGPVVPEGQNPELYKRVVGAYMLRDITPPLLRGLTLTGFVFAFISTVDSYLLSWASVITNDCICSMRKTPLSQKKHLWLLRWVCLGIAVFIFVFGIYYKPSESIIQYFYITGAVFGGCGILTWAGLYWKRASIGGAWICLITACVIPVFFILFKQQIPAMAKLNSDVVALIAITIPITAMVVVSLLGPKTGHFVDYGQRLKEANEKQV